MKIKFLGTAAAEGWPAIFCSCDACNKARMLKGKNIRTRSSCLIDDYYMVDFGADTYMNSLRYGIDLSKLKSVFVTHSHSDHFIPYDFELRYGSYAYIEDRKPLMIYGNQSVKKLFEDTFKGNDLDGSILFNEIEPYKTYRVDHLDLTPHLADHMPDEKCFVYVIQSGKKTLLYGHDSGYYPEETWKNFPKYKFDAVILDCTLGPTDMDLGPDEVWHGHMGINTDEKVKKRLIKMGSANENTKFIVTHFSHNGKLLYDELKDFVSKYGFIVAYDGMEIEI